MPERCDPCSGAVPTIDYQGSNVTADPLVVSDAGRDYRLQSGSPLIGAGVEAYTPTVDLLGNPRVTADIGAYAGPSGGGVFFVP